MIEELYYIALLCYRTYTIYYDIPHYNTEAEGIMLSLHYNIITIIIITLEYILYYTMDTTLINIFIYELVIEVMRRMRYDTS